MNIGDIFNGFRVDWMVALSEEQFVVVGYFLDASTESNNHNILRLEKNGNVIWQVQRDEAGLFDWKLAKALQQTEDVRLPFTRFALIDSNGLHKKENIWAIGDKIMVGCEGVLPWQEIGYELDIEKGIARCISNTHQRSRPPDYVPGDATRELLRREQGKS